MHRVLVQSATAIMIACGSSAGFAAEDAAEREKFRIDFAGPPVIEVTSDELTEEEWFSGQFAGTIAEDAETLFAGTDVTCEFDGYAAQGRAFSCGFTTVEQVNGRCLFTDMHGDAAIAEWTCQTGAIMTSDARCEGKAQWVSGTGKFAGITGDARLHTDLFLQPSKGFAEWKGHWRISTMAGRIE